MAKITSWRGMQLQTPATYRIRVQGRIDASWSDRLGGMSITADPSADPPGVTIQNDGRIFIAGPSGCGKSTLLSLLSGVVVPQKGSVTVLGQRLDALNGHQRDRLSLAVKSLRNRKFTVVLTNLDTRLNRDAKSSKSKIYAD